ncbi:carbohydrate-binding protein [Streptomyces sp. B93]|uniref:carbohydrate-binding protein n=1 Tax=Streptomyces sp. B93 TaxID=2824875 RepID=UPI001B38ED4D|nr:carbohydrate-binding protein [Streptomyces sp. B93]MBQ1089131.1 carbohydrate-binding protein [Streptomyces sp. B93]
MTPGNNGASTPEDDDPFGYLYADGQANGAQPPSGGYGYPNSVSRVRAVGERQYGQQPPAAPPGHGQVPPQQGPYGQPNARYAAPETFPGGAPTAQQASTGTGGRGGGRGGRGPNTKGLLIGAVAVVAAVVIGIGVAMLGGDDGDDDGNTDNQAGPTATQSQSSEPSASSSATDDAEKAELPAIDAKALRLSDGMSTASDVEGAQADGGVYVTGFNQVGAKVTWTINGIEEAGTYRLDVRYGIPGKDADATLLVNGKDTTRPLNMKNFGGTPEGDWERGWQTTWATVNLTKGTNTIELACNEGNKCDVVFDQLAISEG